jgi:predicted kinase
MTLNSTSLTLSRSGRLEIMATLHLICGMAGAGKTTLAKQLEADAGALRLCPDEWIEALVTSKADRADLDRLRTPVEELHWALAKELLGLGVSVILENGFWSRGERSEYRDTAKEIGAQVVLHFLDIPKEELWRRIQIRNADRPEGGFRISKADLDEWWSWFTPPDETESSLYDGFQVYGEAEHRA